MAFNRNHSDSQSSQDAIPFKDAVRIARSPVSEEEKIRLLEERLVVRHYKRKLGDVIVRKVVETQIIEVPVRREKLIVEQVSPERKQLAAIDLDDLQQDDQPIDRPDAPQIQYADAAPTEASQFIPADVARRVLQDITEKPEYQQAEVRLVFADPSLQSIYAQWLERYLQDRS